MQLNIKNIGSIKDSTFTIDGITVLTGVNNTGKSTVSKVLYSTFNSLYNYKKEIRDLRVEGLLTATLFEYFSPLYFPSVFDNEKSNISLTLKKYYQGLLHTTEENKEILIQEITDLIQSLIEDNKSEEYGSPNHSDIKDFVRNTILPRLNISDDNIFKGIMNKYFDNEFNGQVNNIYRSDSNEGSISLTIKKETFSLKVENHKSKNITNPINLKTRAIYLDNPNILSAHSARLRRGILNRTRTYYNHREHALSCLYKKVSDDILEEVLLDEKLQTIFSKLNPIVTGEMSYNENSLGYSVKNSEKALSFNNISSGLKTFIIIEQLIRNRTLEKDGTLILDEPEIHLHPEWQIILAELIVLLQNSFDLHILLTTHSPYFLNAIEIYTKKYKTENKTNYYLAESIDGENNFKNVNKNLSTVYSKLLEPFQKLENIKYD